MATKKNTSAKPVGRPPVYSQDTKDNICARIANGESLRAVCRDNGMPNQDTVHMWLNKDDAFVEQYARACARREDSFFDDLIEIADSVTADAAEVAKARVQIDARKWVLSRMNPKKYGDRVQQEVSGSIGAEVTLIERVIVDPKKNENNDTHTEMD